MTQRKLNGVPTTASHPGAVTLLTALGNTVTLTLREPDVERVAALIAEIIRDDEALGRSRSRTGTTRTRWAMAETIDRLAAAFDPSMTHTRAVRSNRRERLYRRIVGVWPQSLVDRRLDALVRDEAEIKATVARLPRDVFRA